MNKAIIGIDNLLEVARDYINAREAAKGYKAAERVHKKKLDSLIAAAATFNDMTGEEITTAVNEILNPAQESETETETPTNESAID